MPKPSTKKPAKLTKPAPLSAGHILSSFDCGEDVMNLWLAKRALQAVAARTANTFVVCRGKKVVAYYSLATASISHADCTSALRRNAPDPVPAIVLARLAVDRSEQGKGLSKHVLRDAMRRTLVASKHVAARTLIVHALTDRAAATYKRFGFLPLPVGKDGPITLHLPLETIAKSLAAPVA